MQITLTRSGGIIPVTKKAEINVDWNEDELAELRKSIELTGKDEKIRDNTSYTLSYNNNSFIVDLDNLPPKYKDIFDDLKDHLKIVKPSSS